MAQTLSLARGHSRLARIIARRVTSALVLLLAVSALVFVIAQAAPGDPATAILGANATPQRVSALRHSLGLDRSLLAQYLSYLGNLLHGDLGRSYVGAGSVAAIIGQRFTVTAWLVVASLMASVLISAPMAVLSAVRRDTWVDHVLRGATIAMVAMPTFWVGLLLILLIALPTGLLPVGGFGDSLPAHLRSIILPGITLGLALVPVQVRILRGSLSQALRADYVAAARSRGVGGRRAVLRHALPNAVPPALTVISVQAGYLLFGAVVIENTFQLPGLGSAMVTAVSQRDYPVISGITLVFAVTVVVLNLSSELLQHAIDPRLRQS